MTKAWIQRLGLAIVLALASIGMAQQDARAQTQTQNQTAMQNAQNALDELRSVYQELGQIIDQLESDMAQYEALDQRVAAVEEQVRLGVLRQAQRDLDRLQPQIEAGDAPEQTAADISAILQDLQTVSFMGTTQERQGWPELEQSFAVLEQRIHSVSPDTMGAFDEASAQLEQQIGQAQEAQAATARARVFGEAEQRLRDLRQDIAEGNQPQETADELVRIRQDLEGTDVSAERQETFDAFVDQLALLEEQVRSGEDAATETYQSLLDTFQNDLSPMAGQDGEVAAGGQAETDAASDQTEQDADVEQAGPNDPNVGDDEQEQQDGQQDDQQDGQQDGDQNQ